MYMIYQQFQTAIKNTYRDLDDLDQHIASARLAREWLESLEIEDDLRDALVEPIKMLQETFQELRTSQESVAR
jgi:ribosomal 50S subunit-associated protein YjgA (DUF615 family)